MSASFVAAGLSGADSSFRAEFPENTDVSETSGASDALATSVSAEPMGAVTCVEPVASTGEQISMGATAKKRVRI